MSRSDVGKPTGAFPWHRPRDSHPVVINRREDQFGSRRHERAAGARVVRLLHEHAIAGVQQNAADQVQSLLRAVHDHDPVRLCIEPAQATQSGGDGLSELPASGGWTVFQIGQAGMARARAEQPAPEGIRQIGERGTAGAEIVPHALRRQLPGQAGQTQALAASASGPQESLSSSGDDRAGPAGGDRARRARRRRRRRIAIRWQDGRDDRSGRAHACLEIALRQQLLISHHRGVARDIQLPGDLAGGGNPLARGEPAPENLAAQRPVDLKIEASGSIQRQHDGPILSQNTIGDTVHGEPGMDSRDPQQMDLVQSKGQSPA